MLRLFYDGFNRRDFDDALRYVDPGVELYPGVPAPDQDARYSGHEGMAAFFRLATESWVTATATPEEMLEAGDNRILVLDRWHFRGRDGIEIDNEMANAFTLRNGLIVRIDGFNDRASALEAVGRGE